MLQNLLIDILELFRTEPILMGILAVIAVLIIALAIVMIVLSVKAKKLKKADKPSEAAAPSEEKPEEVAEPEEIKAEEVKAEEVKEEPKEEEHPEEKAEEPKAEEPAEAPAEETAEEKLAEEPAEEAPAKDEEASEEPKEEPKEEHDMKKTEPKEKVESVKEEREKPSKKEPKSTSPYVFRPGKAEEEEKKSDSKSGLGGKWVIEEVKGQYWFSLYAPNGQVMLESATPYVSLASARAGITTYQNNIAADRLNIVEHKNGDSQVQVLNGRGGLLATSSTYSTRSQAENAKASIKRWAATSTIEEADGE